MTSGDPTFVRVSYTSHDSATILGSYSGTNVASNAFADVGSSTTVGIAEVRGYVVTSMNSSNWTMEVKSEVANSLVTVSRGSSCYALKVA